MVLLPPTIHAAAALVATATDKVPQENDVKAGWLALFLFLGLIAAVALLCWSFVRQLRKVNAAKEAGLYDRTRIYAPPEEEETDPAESYLQ